MNEKKLVRNAFKDGDVFFNFGDIFFLDKQYYIYFRDRVGDTFRYNKFIDMALWFMIYGASRHFQQYFSYIVAVSFSGGRNRSTLREPTDHGQATGKLYHMRLPVECTLFVIYNAGREPTPYW